MPTLVGMPIDEMAHMTTGLLTAVVEEDDLVIEMVVGQAADFLVGRGTVGMPTTIDLQETVVTDQTEDLVVVVVVADATTITEAGRDTTTTLAMMIPGSEDTSRCLTDSHGLLGGLSSHFYLANSPVIMSGKVFATSTSHYNSRHCTNWFNPALRTNDPYHTQVVG